VFGLELASLTIVKRSQPLVVAITGATSGIGRATARRFAVDRAHVALLARGADGLAATAREVVTLGGRAMAIPIDVADAEQVAAAVLRIERDLGPIDIWINNASTTVFGRADQLSHDELRRVTDVSYHGYVWCTQSALEGMRERNRGTIVQVASAHARRAVPLQAAHCAAQHAVRAFTDALRSELKHDRVDVRLTMVQLPAVNTPHFEYAENKLGFEAQPIPPIFQPELAAEAIHFAATHRRREVWVGASTIRTILGDKLAPALLDRYLSRVVFNQPEVPRSDRVSSLWRPIPGDRGAHGPFEFRARNRDPVARVGTWLGGGGIQTIALAAAAAGVIASGLALAALARRFR
jgi:NADP-dependent 3-hydroxy acid dehydrogenase YdfG